MKAAFVDTLSAVNLVTGGVVVGIVVADLVIILPLIRQLEAANAVSALRFAGSRAWRLAPYSGAAAWFSAVAVIAIWPWHSSSAAALLTIAGLALWTVAVVVTFAWYFPVDARIRGLTPNAAPAEAPSLFQRLAQLLLLRTTFFFAGFVCFVLGAVLT
jgi:hypothetical protein